MNAKREDFKEVVRPRVQKFFPEPSLTRQEFKDECDLELILKRFGSTEAGMAAIQNAVDLSNLRFDDVSAVPDFRAARDQIMQAEAKFMALPAQVRARFDNDAALFLDFATDPKNLDEMRAMGLANPKPVEPVKAG